MGRVIFKDEVFDLVGKIEYSASGGLNLVTMGILDGRALLRAGLEPEALLREAPVVAGLWTEKIIERGNISKDILPVIDDKTRERYALGLRGAVKELEVAAQMRGEGLGELERLASGPFAGFEGAYALKELEYRAAAGKAAIEALERVKKAREAVTNGG